MKEGKELTKIKPQSFDWKFCACIDFVFPSLSYLSLSSSIHGVLLSLLLLLLSFDLIKWNNLKLFRCSNCYGWHKLWLYNIIIKWNMIFYWLLMLNRMPAIWQCSRKKKHIRRQNKLSLFKHTHTYDSMTHRARAALMLSFKNRLYMVYRLWRLQ